MNRLRLRIERISWGRLRKDLGQQSKAWQSLAGYISSQLTESEARSADEVAEDLTSWVSGGVRYDAIVTSLGNKDTIFALPDDSE